MELIRKQIYEIEEATLSQYAFLSSQTKGRARKIEESDVRTEFMRDRDRIVHSKSFRRLKDKTQVFLNPEGSHYRTRLTHTMEVSQIARTIAKALRLNEDLTEAVALGHDLGHTPFGHAGERAIDKHVPFEHNQQSLRIVDKLENGVGLNLTFEVRDGILNHKKKLTPKTLEGMAVNLADRIAYLNHDLDDAARAGFLKPKDLPRDCIEILGDTNSRRINTMIIDVIHKSMGQDRLAMSKEVSQATDRLRDFMFEAVYIDSPAKKEERKVQTIIDMLFEYYQRNQDKLPEHVKENIEEDGLNMCIADHISGMTDKFAVTMFNECYVPKAWAML